jgi:hypothetical protein
MGLPCAIIGALDCSAPLSMELSGPGPYARTQVSQLARTQVSQLAEQGVPGFVMLDLTLERPYDPRLRPDPRTVTTGNNNLWFLRVCVCDRSVGGIVWKCHARSLNRFRLWRTRSSALFVQEEGRASS